MRLLLIIFFITCLYSCTSNEVKDNTSKDSIPAEQTAPVQTPASISAVEPDSNARSVTSSRPSQIPDSSIRINIFKNTDMSGYGYDILRGEKLYIHQPNVPAVPGNNGFETEEQARKVAQMVINKIKNNIMPPTVEKSELSKLGVDTLNRNAH
jgi:hypothetical protein